MVGAVVFTISSVSQKLNIKPQLQIDMALDLYSVTLATTV